MSIPLLDHAVSAVYPFVADAAGLLTPIGAIVVCTVVLRVCLLPLTFAAVRGERARLALAPQVKALQGKHTKNPTRLNEEVAALHRDAGVSPLAGCLPGLVQAPVFMIWYRIFTSGTIGGRVNALLAHQHLGSHLLGGGQPLLFVPLLLIIATQATLTVRRSRQVAQITHAEPPTGPLRYLPYTTLLSALIMPLAAVVYLATTTTWTLLESTVLRRGLPS